jgi:exopolysaccharide production protein ExoQ
MADVGGQDAEVAMNAGSLRFAQSLGTAMAREEFMECGERVAVLFTPAVVGFYFSFRAVLVLIAVRLFLLEPRTGAAAGLAGELILLLVVAFQAVGTARHSLGWMLRATGFRWGVAYLLFAGCSFAWSGAASIAASFFYWCGVVADVALVVLMVRTAPVAAVAHSMMKGFIGSTCVLALMVWVMPAQADLRLGDPEFFNTNQIGNLCAVAILLAQYLMSRKDGKWGAAMLFLFVTLARSLSKTTLVAFLLSEGFLLFRDKSMSRKAKMWVAAGALLVGLSFWGLYANYYDAYTTTGNQAETFTGRTAIWAWALNAALLKPWLGNGFDALWKMMPPFGPDQFEARHAENELLQQFFAYGVAGVVILFGVYASLARRIRRLPQSGMRTVLITILLFVLIRGLAEAEPFDLLLPLWAIALFSFLVESSLDPGDDNPTAESSPSRGSVMFDSSAARRPAV